MKSTFCALVTIGEPQATASEYGRLIPKYGCQVVSLQIIKKHFQNIVLASSDFNYELRQWKLGYHDGVSAYPHEIRFSLHQKYQSN